MYHPAAPMSACRTVVGVLGVIKVGTTISLTRAGSYNSSLLTLSRLVPRKPLSAVLK